MKVTLNANAQAVLEVISAAHYHPTASDIYDEVREMRPKMGLASVYRILHTLVEQGYIRELRHTDDVCRYDAHTERHDHAICTQCGALLDVPIDIQVPQEALQQAAQAAGIELAGHEIRLYGRCHKCHAS